MEDKLNQQWNDLERSLTDLDKHLKRGLGFVETVDYRGVTFNVSRRFVIADLAPLAFFHLVEHIANEDVAGAIERLHERLLPLLTCRHQWAGLKRDSDAHIRSLARTGGGPYVCKSCTAYVLGETLPTIGRESCVDPR